ncbi:hypothetical protein N8987_04000 [Crocinitomix sp.]|nr:hypothetical protein [Crocinitomix sp.]
MESPKLFKIFLITFVSSIVSIVVFNFYFNVYGLFSDYQTSYRVVVNDRVGKYNWIINMEEKPEAYIFGSSNSMRMNPDSIESITGLKSFNMGMFHARVEDFWCMANALLNSDETHPKLIIFCIDDWNFADEPPKSDEIFQGAEKRLAYKPVLSKYLDDFSKIKLNWGKLSAALTFDHFENSFLALQKCIIDSAHFQKNIPTMLTTFYENGVRKKYGKMDEPNRDITDTCETGTYDMTASLKEINENWKTFPFTPRGILDKSHSAFDKLSDRRIKLFERMIKMLNKYNCKVILNMMPNQPYFKKIIEEQTTFKTRLNRLLTYFNKLKMKYDNIILIKDNSDISNFNGDPNHFFDYMHPTSVNSDRMIESMRTELQEYAF